VIVADDEPKEQFHLSFAQILASCLAAVSAAVLCSLFGVAGTIIGTAIFSLIATVGSALYTHSLNRTRARLRRMHRAGAASPPVAEVLRTALRQRRESLRQIPWRVVGIGSAAVFVISLGVITVIEISAGESLSSVFGVSHSGTRGTSLGSVFDSRHHRGRRPTPSKSSSSPAPTATPAPTVTVTQTRTETSTPTPTSTATSLAPTTPASSPPG
jgi:hypothetical protein